MQRIIEPELMIEEEQSHAYAQADFVEPNIHFVNLFKETFGEISNGNILDIGCGNADITLRFAKAYPDCFIDGIDGSESMLSYARKTLLEASLELQKRVRLIQGIVPDVKLPQAHYDVIISNSVLHHIHNPYVLWQFIKTYGVDGTKIFIGDLFRPSSPEKAMEIVELYAKDEPEILKRDFYNSLLAAFEITEIREQLKIANIDILSVEQISDRHVLISGFL
ncbi:MAG: methyltransferase domain-containing protein [Xenococcus sp. MO_188.B8]|nr:methyltransferase domain-containing protein [Xenococcus sp. MO_188.B8]